MAEKTTTQTEPAPEDAAAKAAAEKAAADKAATDEAAAKAAADTGDEDLLKGAKDPDAVRNALKAERETAKQARDKATAEKDRADKLAEKVQQFEDRDKSEQEKAEQKAADAEKKAEAAEKKLLRLEVAGEKKLPATLAARLSGDTKEELEADADELLKIVKSEETVPDFDSGARQTASPGTDMNAKIRELAGR
jgi:hypothetical protein